MKICVEEYNVNLKIGLIQLLIEWTNLTTSSVLYDSKFVQLLVSAIFTEDEILSNYFDKKKMNFSKVMKILMNSYFFQRLCHLIVRMF